MSLLVNYQEPDAIIRKLNRINKQMDSSFIRDYGGISMTSAYFMSLPVPCWIKVVKPMARGHKFKIVQSNYSYFDAYGVKPEDNWDESKYFSAKEVELFHKADLAVLNSSSRKPIISVENIYNENLQKPESLTVYKWVIEYGDTVAVAGAVIDPTYIEHLIERHAVDTDMSEYDSMTDVDILKRMETLLHGIDRARKNIAINSELIKQFFDNSPIPMWICQYVGGQSSPQKARFPLAQQSKGFKPAKIIDTANERLAAISKSIVENGQDVRHRKTVDASSIKRVNWPIYMNGELRSIGGVIIGLDK